MDSSVNSNPGEGKNKEATKAKSSDTNPNTIENNSIFKPKLNMREASHAGTWYSSKEFELSKQLQCWLEMIKVDNRNISRLKVIFSPHAGFAYSGPTAAAAFKHWRNPKDGKPLKIFVLGPCHYISIRSCAVSLMEAYENPLGSIKIDKEIAQELINEGNFEILDKDADEEEHSVEMQLPFLKKVLGDQPFTLIPILVGFLDKQLEEYYANILLKYFDRDDSVFVISTDFCHWGTKFGYTPLNPKDEADINTHVESLDKKARDFIEAHDLMGFEKYLAQTENNICGKHCISIFLSMIKRSVYRKELVTKFIKYSQSSLVKDKKDSTIGFASGITFFLDYD